VFIESTYWEFMMDVLLHPWFGRLTYQRMKTVTVCHPEFISGSHTNYWDFRSSPE